MTQLEPSSARKLRFGLIGCGSQGRYLSEALRMTERAQLVACADINPEATALAMRQCGYQTACTDAAQMLSETDLDAVIIATTHDQLQPLAMAAVKAGKHVFVEKPMALTAAHGRELVDAAKQAGVKLMVGYTFRFLPERIHIKNLLDAGAVGDMAHVLAGQVIGPMGGWLADPARGGGPLFYIGTHVLYQVLWVVGRPAERVYAEVQRNPNNGVETEALITIRFAGGVVAQVCTSQKLGGRYGWIDVLGSAGRVRAEWESNVIFVESQAIEAYRNPTLIEVPLTAHLPSFSLNATASVVAFRYIRSWAAEFVEFINAIQEDRESAVTGEDGVRVLEITDAVFESGRTGLPIAMKNT